MIIIAAPTKDAWRIGYHNTYRLDQRIDYLDSAKEQRRGLMESIESLNQTKQRVIQPQISFIEVMLNEEVAKEFPPRKGNDADRKTYLDALKSKHDSLKVYIDELADVEHELRNLNRELDLLEKQVKSDRAILDFCSSELRFMSSVG